MPVKSGSRPHPRNLAPLLLLFPNVLGLILISELFSMDEMIRYHEDGSLTSCEFKAQALLLLAVAAANIAAGLIMFLNNCQHRPVSDTNH